MNSLKLDAKSLRAGVKKKPENLSKNEIYLILDNVLDTYNIGSIFRLSDALSCQKIYLCGDMETPPNPRIKKASINTTEWVEWEYQPSAIQAINHLKAKVRNLTVVAVEQSDKSTRYDQYQYHLPICLVVGNETEGISKEVLQVVDAIVEIPLFGVNISLNVMVSLAIVLYQLVESCNLDDR